MRIRAIGKTDIGLKRKLNEDNLLIAPDLGLYVVADGMGGHKAGEVASRMVVETMADYWKKVRSGQPPSLLSPVHKEPSVSAKHLVNSISLSNMLIHEAQKRVEYHRMGSTVSALLQDGERFWLANVGDSPVYYLNQERLTLISEEHSLQAESRNLGLETDDPLGSTNPLLKNILTRVLGLNERVEVYLHPLRPKPGDMVMMCSDGLTNYLPVASIRTILSDGSIPIERKADILVKEANEAGGGDNITVILIEILEEGKWQRLKRKIIKQG